MPALFFLCASHNINNFNPFRDFPAPLEKCTHLSSTRQLYKSHLDYMILNLPMEFLIFFLSRAKNLSFGNSLSHGLRELMFKSCHHCSSCFSFNITNNIGEKFLKCKLKKFAFLFFFPKRNF